MTANWASVLWRTAERAPTRVAIRDGDTSVDYAGLRDRAATYAQLLVEAGVQPGDRVALLFRRSWDAVAAFAGVLAAGGVAVVLADVLRPRQIEHVVGHSGAVALVIAPDATQHHRELEIAAKILAPPPLPEPSSATTPHPPAAGPSREPVLRAGGDVAELVYTSGSTGLPKGVTVTHANLHAGVAAVSEYLGIDDDDRIASLLPFSFDYGKNQMLVAVAAGATLVIERSSVAARIDRTLRDAEVTVTACVPTLWNQLLQVPRFRDEPIPSLRIMTNTGGRLPEDTVRRLRAAQPQAALFSMYGLTEAFRSTYLDPALIDQKPTSIGRAIPGADVWVARPDGSRCDPYEVGEIVHRGPTVTLGYWEDPVATSRVFRPAGEGAGQGEGEGHPDPGDVVVHSGDFAWMDADGDLYVEGRRDRMVKRLGYRVSTDEVAEVVFASGLVRDACVTAIPGPEEGAGADLVGHVVLTDGADVEALDRYLAVELPRHLRPSRLLVHDALPTTPHGKHDVHALEELAR